MEKEKVEKDECYKVIPRPRGSFCIGNLFQVNPATIHVDLYNLMIEYGEIFNLNMLGENIVFLNSADLCRQAFTKQELHGRPDIFYALYLLYGKKCISNAEWTETTIGLRKMKLALMQTHSEMMKSLDPLFQEELNRFTTSLSDTAGTLTNINELIKVSIGNTLSIALNGTKPTPEKTQKIIDFDIEALFKDGLVVKLTKLPILRHLPGRAGSVYRELVRTRDEMLEAFVDGEKPSCTSSDEGHGYVQHMLAFIEDEKAKNNDEIRLTDDHVRGLITDFLAGSFGPIVVNLCMAFLLLMKHPAIQTRMQLEIDGVLAGREPTHEDRPRLHLTQAVILESFRYGSMIPITIGHLATTDVEVDGYIIPHGTQVFGNLFGIHHDAAVWGDPFAFRPERFLDADGTLIPADHPLRMSVIPFSAGVRTCTGRDFALSRLFLYVTSVLQKFDLRESDAKRLPDPEPRDWKFCAVLEIPDIMCILRKRDESQ